MHSVHFGVEFHLSAGPLPSLAQQLSSMVRQTTRTSYAQTQITLDMIAAMEGGHELRSRAALRCDSHMYFSSDKQVYDKQYPLPSGLTVTSSPVPSPVRSHLLSSTLSRPVPPPL